MKPIYSITLGTGASVVAIEGRLVSIEITDQPGVVSDDLRLVIDNQDNRIEPPRRGVQLRVALGFEETGLIDRGSFTVDWTRTAGPVRTLEIRAAAIDLRTAAKAPKTREWKDTTLGQIVKTIATENDLKPRVATELAKIAYEHLSQTGESDLHFLTRLALEIGAIAKVADGNLVVAWRGRGETVSGEKLPVIALGYSDFTEWQASDGERDRYESCTAYWHDKRAAKRQEVHVGDGEPSYKMRRTFPDKEIATRAASAELRRLNRSTGRFTGSLAIARVDLSAEQIILPNGLGAAEDRRWITTSVTHRLDGALTTEFEAELEDEGNDASA